MKLRTGYVSNSSSSSFVVMKSSKPNPFNGLTAQDWRDAIKALYVEHDEGYGPLAEEASDVRDLEHDRENALKDFRNLMGCWFANLSVRKDGRIVRNVRSGRKAVSDWEKYMDRLAYGPRTGWRRSGDGYADKDGYRFSLYGWPLSESMIEQGLCKYDEEQGKTVYRPLPKKLADEVREKWRSLGACTQLDLLESPDSKTFVHFDENEIWQLDGTLDEHAVVNDDNTTMLKTVPSAGKGWSTEEWTFERVVEVFARWFRENGRVARNANWRRLYELVGGVSIHEG